MLRPFPRTSQLGAPHVWYTRGLATIRFNGVSGSSKGFDELTPSLHPSVRLDNACIDLDRREEPLAALVSHPTVQRADALHLRARDDVQCFERFTAEAGSLELLTRFDSIAICTRSPEIVARCSAYTQREPQVEPNDYYIFDLVPTR